MNKFVSLHITSLSISCDFSDHTCIYNCRSNLSAASRCGKLLWRVEVKRVCGTPGSHVKHNMKIIRAIELPGPRPNCDCTVFFFLIEDAVLHKETDKRKLELIFTLLELETGATCYVTPICNPSSRKVAQVLLLLLCL